jgi:hypothetical protein
MEDNISKSKQINVILNNEELLILERLAYELRGTKAQVIRLALKQYVESNKQKFQWLEN